MTKLENQLLDILREDCRISLEKLALMTGEPVTEVAEAIERLEKEKVILRYAPIVNWDKTDRDRVEAMIEVRVLPQREQGFDAVASRIYALDEVKSVYLMSPDAEGARALRLRKALRARHGDRNGHGLCAQALQRGRCGL